MTPYGPAERLQEQVSILVSESHPTAIVQLSLLGEPAVPYLTELLAREGSDEEASTFTAEANAITRALGMIASDRALPALAERFRKFESRRPYSRSSSSDAFRITANALRKIGTAEALEALIRRLGEFDVEHANATFGSFGEEGMTKVVTALQDRTGDELRLAIELVVRWKRADAVPFLLALLNATQPADAVAAAYGLARVGDVPRQPLMAAFAQLAEEWVGREAEYNDDAKGRYNLYVAIIAAVYHSQGPEIAPDVLKWAALESTRSKERAPRASGRRRLRDVLISYGKPALPFVEANISGQPEDVRAVALEIAHKIHEGEVGEVPKLPRRRDDYAHS